MQVDFARARAYFADPAVSRWSKLLGVLALVYVFSPIDAIPDIVPIAGWLDDAGIITAVAAWTLSRISRYSPAPRPAKGEPQDRLALEAHVSGRE